MTKQFYIRQFNSKKLLKSKVMYVMLLKKRNHLYFLLKCLQADKTNCSLNWFPKRWLCMNISLQWMQKAASKTIYLFISIMHRAKIQNKHQTCGDFWAAIFKSSTAPSQSSVRSLASPRCKEEARSLKQWPPTLSKKDYLCKKYYYNIL